MKRFTSAASVIALTVAGFAQPSTPGCTPAPGQTTCTVPGGKSIWNNPAQTYGLLVGVPVGIAGALIVRHHYRHKAQQELKRMEDLKNPQAANSLNSTNSVTADYGAWGFSAADWKEGGFTGVQIVRVSPSRAAEIAGLNVGNVIMTVNGKSVGSNQEMAATMEQSEPGSTVKIAFLFKTQLGWMPKETALIVPKSN